MSDADLRIDPLTGAYVVVTPWRQQRPNRPDGCPFCPGGLEAPEPYHVRHFPNRWPALPDGCHEVILHSPEHGASFPVLGEEPYTITLPPYGFLWFDLVHEDRYPAE